MAFGQHTIVKGIVTDSVTGEALPSVTIVFKGTNIGTTTDIDGHFFSFYPYVGKSVGSSLYGV